MKFVRNWWSLFRRSPQIGVLERPRQSSATNFDLHEHTWKWLHTLCLSSDDIEHLSNILFIFMILKVLNQSLNRIPRRRSSFIFSAVILFGLSYKHRLIVQSSSFCLSKELDCYKYSKYDCSTVFLNPMNSSRSWQNFTNIECSVKLP